MKNQEEMERGTARNRVGLHSYLTVFKFRHCNVISICRPNLPHPCQDRQGHLSLKVPDEDWLPLPRRPVGGMFLFFFQNCMDRSFTQVYFVIGIFHFICGVVENLDKYAYQSSAMDGTISNVEGKLTWYSWLLVQILRIAKVPMVVVALLEGSSGPMTGRRSCPVGDGWVGNCTVCFCEGT